MEMAYVKKLRNHENRSTSMLPLLIATGGVCVYNVPFSASRGICLLDNLECSSSSWVNRDRRKYRSVRPNICLRMDPYCCMAQSCVHSRQNENPLTHGDYRLYNIPQYSTHNIISVNLSEYWHYFCFPSKTSLFKKHAVEIMSVLVSAQ